MPRFAANLSMLFTEVPFLERFEPVCCLPHHLEVGLRVEDHHQPGPDQILVVGDHHANAHAGSIASTTQPPSGPGPAVSDPPRSWARSVMPSRPNPGSEGVAA